MARAVVRIAQPSDHTTTVQFAMEMTGLQNSKVNIYWHTERNTRLDEEVLLIFLEERHQNSCPGLRTGPSMMALMPDYLDSLDSKLECLMQ